METDHYDPFDIDSHLRREILLHGVFPLTEVPSRYRGNPGIYMLYYKGTARGWEDELVANRSPDATQPIYIGESTDLDSRFSEHTTLLRTVYGLEPEDFLVRALMMGNEPHARKWAETICIDAWDPLWNKKSHAGFGSRNQTRKTNTPPAWHRKYPGANRFAEGTWKRSEKERAHLERSRIMSRGYGREMDAVSVLHMFKPWRKG